MKLTMKLIHLQHNVLMIYAEIVLFPISLSQLALPRSKTLIGNILFNDINEAITSGDLMTDISNHCVKFLITSNVLENKPNKLIHKRCFKKFNEDLFANDLQKTKSKAILTTDLNDVNFSFSQLILKINELLNIHVAFKYFKPKIKKKKCLGLQVV